MKFCKNGDIHVSVKEWKELTTVTPTTEHPSEKDLEILVQVDNGGYFPTKVHDNDAGYDLRCPMFKDDNGVAMDIDTKVHVLIPKGYVGLILPRSRMTRRGYLAATGVIDAGYTGSIRVFLTRLGNSDRAGVYSGERIAQLVILPLANSHLALGNVKEVKTERGEKGFGSSGR